jgi:hypothetical protein
MFYVNARMFGQGNLLPRLLFQGSYAGSRHSYAGDKRCLGCRPNYAECLTKHSEFFFLYFGASLRLYKTLDIVSPMGNILYYEQIDM